MAYGSLEGLLFEREEMQLIDGWSFGAAAALLIGCGLLFLRGNGASGVAYRRMLGAGLLLMALLLVGMAVWMQAEAGTHSVGH